MALRRGAQWHLSGVDEHDSRGGEGVQVQWRASYGGHGAGRFVGEGGGRGFSTFKASRAAQTGDTVEG